jgi:hypothetical protein
MTSICVGIEKPEGRVHFAGEQYLPVSGLDAGRAAIGLASC